MMRPPRPTVFYYATQFHAVRELMDPFCQLIVGWEPVHETRLDRLAGLENVTFAYVEGHPHPPPPAVMRWLRERGAIMVRLEDARR